MSGSPVRTTAAGTLVALAACAALTACSSGGPAPTSDDVAQAGRGRVLTGGTLHWAVDAVPPTLNAYRADATDATALVDSALLPAMFTLDGHARPTPDADYLTGAEVTSRQPQTVVYHLNPKAVWSTGAPLSAADFAAQWKALSGRGGAFGGTGTEGYDDIGDVRQGATPRDVQVTFSTPYAPWRRLFSPLLPTAVTSTPAAFGEGTGTALAADAGPFTLKSEQPDQVLVVRNPRWWGARAKLDGIAFTAVAPRARVDALRAGRLDVADVSRAVGDGGTGISASAASDAAASAESRSYAQVQSLSGITLHRASAPGYLGLTLNGGRGPLADPALRRAVAAAVNRQRIADAVLTPLGLPAVPLGNHLVMADQDGYRDDSDALDASPGSAARQLDADGWQAPAKGGARTKGGHPLSLRLLTRAGSAVDTQVAALVTAQLAAVGVPVVTEAVPEASFFTDHVAPGAYDLALFSWPGSAFPVAGELPLYAKPGVDPDGAPVDGANLSGTGTDEIDQLLTQAGSALDQGAATRLAAEADTRIWELAPSVPLFQNPQLVAVRNTVSNAGAFGFAAPRFADLGFTALPGTAANRPAKG
ncbi:ABC transporter family substrate-binding protein [Streptacidiphilus sp. P02-A3a]|uniref:ABC transporter family substrate-binding protein n=1 Tax=Streptacidiphilus sp. P02-A3a TaxID=2704468 RepID=UPI0015FAD9F0|nr:ABC transporter family substrate-binding protein [Streptacidiphilus sp. P02-A3a]QMU67699.1 ABC transporter family substrate-binding protein [Streptacidiphilus sp. P02-A3a]